MRKKYILRLKPEFGGIDEIWEVILYKNQPTNYEVSTHGRIRNKTTGKIRSPFIDKDGYYKISLRINGVSKNFFIHRLVAIQFVDNPEPSINNIVNHKNGIKSDLFYDNFEWTTISGNTKHGYDELERKPVTGDNHGQTLYSDEFVHHVCQRMLDGEKVSNLCKEYGLHRSYFYTLRNCRKRKEISSLYFEPKETNYLDDLTIHSICQYIKDGHSLSETAKKFNISPGYAGNIKNLRTKKEIASQYFG